MTQPATTASTASRIHTAGAVCLAAGLGGAVASVYLAMVSPVGTDGFTFPHGAEEFTGLQAMIALLRVGLIFGLLGLWWSGAAPRTRSARLGRHLALVMMAVLTTAEGLAVTVPSSPLDSTPPAFGVVYGACTILLGAALLAEGLDVARGGTWPGWKRWLPLSLGVWLLLVVLPTLALSFDAARWAMSAWLLLFAVLGFVLTREDNSAPGQPTAEPQTRMRSAQSAAVVTWVYAAAFGAPIIPNAAYIAQNGRLPWFLDAFPMYGGPWADPFEEVKVLLLLTGFLVVTLAAAWAAWLVWNGSMLGGVLALALLPAEAAFWYGFALPLPWLLGLARVILLIAAWKSLSWRRTQTTTTR
jgi:Ca2+/Na+ antiporter